MICAGRACSVDVKYADIMMLNPANGILQAAVTVHFVHC